MRAAMSNLAPVIGVAAAWRMLGVPRRASWRTHRAPAPMPADGTPSLADGSADGQTAAHGHDPLLPAMIPTNQTVADPLLADPPLPARRSPRARSPTERSHIRATLKSERFADLHAPRRVRDRVGCRHLPLLVVHDVAYPASHRRRHAAGSPPSHRVRHAGGAVHRLQSALALGEYHAQRAGGLDLLRPVCHQ